MNINGGRHHYEGYCVSWKAERISPHARVWSVRSVSEREMTLAAVPPRERTSSQPLLLKIPNMCLRGEQKDGH